MVLAIPAWLYIVGLVAVSAALVGAGCIGVALIVEAAAPIFKGAFLAAKDKINKIFPKKNNTKSKTMPKVISEEAKTTTKQKKDEAVDVSDQKSNTRFQDHIKKEDNSKVKHSQIS